MGNIFVDMDGTLVEWVNATLDELMAPGFFLHGNPYENVVDAVRTMIREKQVNVSSLSAYLENSETALAEKNSWLDNINFPKDGRYFVPIGGAVGGRDAKVQFIERALGRKINKGDILLDDFSQNLHAWEAAGGTAVKLMNGVNGSKGTWKGARVSRFIPADEIAAYLSNIAAACVA